MAHKPSLPGHRIAGTAVTALLWPDTAIVCRS